MQQTLPDIRSAYFIGIGGVSMSSLASILLLWGKRVYGYDMKRSDVTDKLAKEGAVVTYDAESGVPSDVDTVIYTAAVKADHPLLQSANAQGMRILSRAQLLGRIAGSYPESIGVAGTHGKSTTTGLLSSICLAEDPNTAVLAGANLPFLGSCYRCGNGKRIVYEACEYKNSYHAMIPSLKVVLNCEHDHVDFFPTIDDVIASFRKYIDEPRKEDGKNRAVIDLDSPGAVKASEGTNAERFFYSVRQQTDFYADAIDLSTGYGRFTLHLNDGTVIPDIQLKLTGIHNVSNAVAAAAAAYISGVGAENIRKGLEDFTGVSRRFEYLGEFCGAKLYDDYAHHPDEIAATLNAARNLKPSRLVCVFQPHTYTRTHELLPEFAQALSLADKVYLCDIYAAREVNTSGVRSQDIADRMQNAICPGSFEDIASLLRDELRPGDLCITMGAGEAFKVARILLNVC